MSVRLKCLCGKVFKVPDGTWGKKVRCPQCSRLLRIPAKPEDGIEEALKAEEASRLETGVEPVTVSSEEAPPQPQASSDETASKGRILVAESNAADREAASRLLADHGYEVIPAEDGEKAVELIRSLKPDLAVVDLKTGKLSGFQVIRAITDQFNPLNREVWRTPFIMTAPEVSGRDRQYAVSLGVEHYYSKPLTPAKICARIEKMLGRLPSGPRRM
jgi:CheY-like chemotaxis protein